MTNHRLVEGDERQKQHGCLHFLDLAERGAGFKMRLAIEASANLQCRQRSKQGGDVEQRHRRPDTVILIEFPAVPPKITGFAHYCLMAEETALRVCGGARGIKDHCCVADANANTGAVDDVFPDGKGASIERGPVSKDRRSLPTQQDEAAQLGRFWKVGQIGSASGREEVWKGV